MNTYITVATLSANTHLATNHQCQNVCQRPVYLESLQALKIDTEHVVSALSVASVPHGVSFCLHGSVLTATMSGCLVA